jgi:hypothetical protein
LKKGSAPAAATADFVADHAFVFVVRNVNYNETLILGRVVDPNKTKSETSERVRSIF